jgi:hypothetical protein
MARTKAKKAARRPAPKQATPRVAKRKESGGSEVERRWKEYWVRRKQLEEAVGKVRAASDVLKSAREQEKTRRAEFDEIKRLLTKLLDIDPVDASAREPIPLPRIQDQASKQLS